MKFFLAFSSLKIRPWIRIRIRIRMCFQNPGSGSARNGCGCETLSVTKKYNLKAPVQNFFLYVHKVPYQ